MKLLLLAVSALPLVAAERPWLAVVEKIGGNLAFYNPAGERVASVKAGPVPHEVVLSPDGAWLYVSDNGILWMTDPGEGANSITIVDVKRRSAAGKIDLGKYHRPHGMDVDAATNRMVVTTENPDGLLLIDLKSRRVLRFYDVQGADPHWVVLGPRAEFAYVANTGSNTIAVVHLESGKVKLIATDKRPQGGARSPSGNLIYYTNSDGNSISIIDPQKNERVGTIYTSTGPNRVMVTPDGGTLVYSLQMGSAVGFADAATRKEVFNIPLGGRPLSLRMSADGRWAYAGVQDQDKIHVISVAERKVVQVIQTPKGTGPDPAQPLP